MAQNRTVVFSLGGMRFEYDEEKNRRNIKKHGVSFRSAARVFFDYDRIEMYDEENSKDEERYNTIGDISAGNMEAMDAAADKEPAFGKNAEVLFVVYTERIYTMHGGKKIEVTRMISARMATSFERGLYYGKY